MTGADGLVSSLSPEGLRRLRLAGTAETIPQLSDVLAIVRGRVPLMLEIKNDGRAGKFEDAVVDQLTAYHGEVAIVSFNPFSLGRIALLAPQIPRGQTAGLFKDSPMPDWRRWLQRNYLLNAVSRPHFLLHELEGLPCRAVTWRRKIGAKVIAYTVRSDGDAAKARAEADNFIFEGIRP
jgi:glycerophosphoryl diester phosphodiesterase